jgi:serine/threonine protein kinase/WD40 repeat protein
MQQRDIALALRTGMFDMATNSDPWIGRRLGKYQILRALGRGGMGIVYEAEDTRLQRPVALKILPESLARDEVILKRFLLEARSAARLSHPNVIAVYDIGQREGTYYLALELVRGMNLQQVLVTRGPLAWADATRACADVCRGLAAAHAADLIHRDIKPSNILVTGIGNQELGIPEGRPPNAQASIALPANAVVKIADFGLAKFTTQTAPRLTTLNCTVGTPAYMSPEQCSTKPVDALSDIYSLGATYFALLVGRPPYESDGNDMNTLAAHCTAPVPDPRQYRPEIPAACAAIVMRAMAKQRGERYTGAQEMLGALTAALTPPQPVAAFAVVPRPTGATARTQFIDPARGNEMPRPRWRRLALIALPVLLVSIAACAGLTALLMRPGTADPQPVLLDPVAVKPTTPTIALRPLRKLDGLGAPVVGLAFRPDGKRLFSADKQSIRAWDVDTGIMKEPIAGNKKITALALFPDGKRLAAATQDRRIFLWGLRAEEPLGGFGPFHSEVVSLATSPDDKLLAVGTGGELQVWDVEGAQRRFFYPQTQYHVSAVAFSGDGKLLAWVNYQKEVHIVDTSTWQSRAEALQQPGELDCVAFTADDNSIIFGGRDAVDPGSGVLMRWDFSKAGAKPRSLAVEKGALRVLALLPDGNSLLHSGGWGGPVRLLDLNTERSHVVATVGQTALRSLAISNDGRLIAGGMDDGAIQLWEVERATKGP